MATALRAQAEPGWSRGILGRWLPVVLWAVCISTFSTSMFAGDRTGTFLMPLLHTIFPSARPERLVAMHHALRKLAHFSEYWVLSLLLYRALRRDDEWSLRAAVLSVVIAGLYAAVDEFHQWFVPGRTATPADCLIDISGAAAAQGL